MSAEDPGALPETAALEAPSPHDPERIEIRIAIQLATFRRLLVGGVVFLTQAGFVVEVADHLNWQDPYYFIEFFGLSYEENLPTWYSSILLLLSSVALSFIALAKRGDDTRYRAHWWVLAAVFCLISLDEIAQNHEQISNLFDYRGVLYFGWVIPAGIFVTLFGLSYLRFLFHLPRRIAINMAGAGAIYVFGALVMELPLGYWTDQQGIDNLMYGMIDLIEESMEIVGVSLFLFTLLEHLADVTAPVAPSAPSAPESLAAEMVPDPAEPGDAPVS